MGQLRRGVENRCPHEVLDPRDLKFFRNRGGYYWDPKDDPFAWRDALPFARYGLAELLVFSLIFFGGAAIVGALAGRLDNPWRFLGFIATTALTVIGILIVWFFRNPRRAIPAEPGSVVSPADGKIVAIDELEYDEFIGGPAIQIGIFLSIFNVHINRVPVAGRVVGMRYRKGKFLNALRPESARENEQLAVRFQETAAPHRCYIIRQITGALARRIVCWVKPGDMLEAGQQFGMIKLGSRTELVLPKSADLTIEAKLGDAVCAGSTRRAIYRSRSGAH
jgi:phosphatidylserine decarboxylase